MKPIIELLELIGRQSTLNQIVHTDAQRIFDELNMPDSVQKALLNRDLALQAKLFGIKQDIVCYISIPSKDKETPKDDNQPEPEDIPDQDDQDNYAKAS